MSSFKGRIRKKELLIGSWIQLPDVFTAEIMSKAGFDWLAIDMEHGLIDLNDVFKLIQVIDLAGNVPLVRLNKNDPSTIRRVMDAGARGVIVPMVNSKEDAERAVDAVKYPPSGKRSFGLGRAYEYGKKFKEYIKSANNSSVVIVQIEHIDALDEIEAILEVDRIDGVIIGQYDLSGSMGIPGKFKDKRFNTVINEITNKVRKTDKLLGTHIVHPSEDEFRKRVSQGFKFIGYGMDTIFLSEGANMWRNIKIDRKNR